MSVPHFTDEMRVPLRRAMLARQPTFVFTPADIEALVQETGLLKAQIQDWAKHFRNRLGHNPLEDILADLRGTGEVT